MQCTHGVPRFKRLCVGDAQPRYQPILPKLLPLGSTSTIVGGESSETVVSSVSMPSNFQLPTPSVVMNPSLTVVATTTSQLPTSSYLGRSSVITSMATQNQFPLSGSFATTPITTVLTSVAVPTYSQLPSLFGTGLRSIVPSSVAMATQHQFTNPSIHVTTASMPMSVPMATQWPTNAYQTASLQNQLPNSNAVPGINTEQFLPDMTGMGVEELLQQLLMQNVEVESNASIGPRTLPGAEPSSLGGDELFTIDLSQTRNFARALPNSAGKWVLSIFLAILACFFTLELD